MAMADAVRCGLPRMMASPVVSVFSRRRLAAMSVLMIRVSPQSAVASVVETTTLGSVFICCAVGA